MEIVTLPGDCPEHYYYTTYTEEEKEAYREWVRKAKDMIGLPQSVQKSPGIGRYTPYRYAWHNGVLYESRANLPTFRRFFSQNAENDIETICECGGSQFKVIQKQYQGTNLRCLGCGELVVVSDSHF